MAIFASIGNAFKDGWNRQANERNKSKEYSEKSFQPNNFQFKHHPDSINNVVDHYSNVNSVSFTKPGHISSTENVNDYTELYSLTTYPYQKSLIKDHNGEQIQNGIENNFKLPYNVLRYVSKNYRFIYQHAADIITDYGMLEKDKDSKSVTFELIDMPVVPSLFNPFYGLNIKGITANTPLLNNGGDKNGSAKVDEYGENMSKVSKNYGIDYLSDYNDISDCSIKKLVELSEKGKMGRAMYKYADFMYCKNLGKVSNNRLITLRKFPLPIGDDIWHPTRYDNGKPLDSENKGGPDIPVDVGRLVTWLDDTNKLEDILKYEYKEGWEEKTGKIQTVDSDTDSPDRGILGSFVNLANPTYRQWVGSGATGGGNKILNAFAGSIGTQVFSATGTNQGSEARKLLTNYDENRVYEPTGTIRKTHLYTGELEFNQNFSLTFDYELRAYENINPRTAFLDLMNNIHQVTYRSGKFWGGQVWFVGAPDNINGWNNANAFIDGTFDKFTDVFCMLLKGDLNFGDFLGGLANNAAQFINNSVNTFSKAMQKGSEQRDKAAEITRDTVSPILKSMLKNALGRPALYATNSILTGEPVGLWHVTIGNPRNPIMSMGNLIIESSTVQQYGPLGIDDFPTGLKVTVNLKHAKPRDMIEIGKMYTMGTVGLGVPLGRTRLEHMVDNIPSYMNLDEHRFKTSWANTTPSFTTGTRDKTERK